MSIADKLTTIAENEQKVFNAGVKSERDRFWDAFQQNGTRVKYGYAFNLWNPDNFYPKYDIKPEGDVAYFARDMIGTPIDLVERLNECGVTMDFSNCTRVTYLFYQSKFSHIPELDLRNTGTSSGELLFGKDVITVDKIILTAEGQSMKNTFGYCSGLENVVIEGTITVGFDVHWSTNLTHDSLMSLLNALKDYSDDASGTAHTVTVGETNLAKLSEEDLKIATDKGWEVL